VAREAAGEAQSETADLCKPHSSSSAVGNVCRMYVSRMRDYLCDETCLSNERLCPSVDLCPTPAATRGALRR
jgi:hypothetical protein